MKILLLADPASTHTIKWANALALNGISVFLFGLNDYNKKLFYPDIKIDSLLSAGRIKNNANGSFTKIFYLSSIIKLKRIISNFNPDIIHAHYASSYGLLSAFSGFHPNIISAWGTDILKFPEKSFLHRKLLEFNLSRAERVLATSNSLAASVKKYYNGHVDIIPFGIDTSIFKPDIAKKPINNDSLVIGTIKTMEDTYGIDYLIRAFKKVKDKNPDKKLNLLLVGGGSQIEKYKSLAASLNVINDVIFTGYIEHENIPLYHNMMDIEVFLSRYESFGVSVLEASACEKPVVVSGVGGLLEVVDKDSTGFIVKPENVEEAAASINSLVRDENLRNSLGCNGRKKVLQQFSWDTSIENMIKIYNEIIS